MPWHRCVCNYSRCYAGTSNECRLLRQIYASYDNGGETRCTQPAPHSPHVRISHFSWLRHQRSLDYPSAKGGIIHINSLHRAAACAAMCDVLSSRAKSVSGIQEQRISYKQNLYSYINSYSTSSVSCRVVVCQRLLELGGSSKRQARALVHVLLHFVVLCSFLSLFLYFP